jgi:TonB family protein
MAPVPQYGEFRDPLAWREPVTPGRASKALLVSLAVHLVALAAFLALPRSEPRHRAPLRLSVDVRRAVKLVAPRSLELTQKDPNRGKVTQELDIRSAYEARPAPRLFQMPAPPGPASRPPAAAPSLTAPDLEAHVDLPELGGLVGVPSAPPTLAPPKPVLENLGPAPSAPVANPALKAPKASIADLAAGRPPGGGGGGVFSDGENGDPASVGNMQLLSDPQNVDFKPYMLQVLNMVRRQWFAIIPQIARTGRQGIVVLQFSVNRAGQVPKLVIANTSGTPAFDQAAVASVSASTPFPPLPAEYRGSEIRLQLAFTYNVPRVR